MPDLTLPERDAIKAAIPSIAGAMDAIGWQTRFSDLSEAQVLTLIETAVHGFQTAMRAYAAANCEVPF